MTDRLTDEQLALAQAKHIARGLDLLMDAMGVPASSLLRPKPTPTVRPVPLPDSALHWAEFPLNERGWCLHLGYTFAGDPDDDGDIEIVKILLNTGYQGISLTHLDLDKDTFFACEEQCRDEWRKSCEEQP